jgi:hypothetical protein
MIKLFPKFADKYKLPPQPTLPPVMTIVFDAVKSPEVNEMMQIYQDEIITAGYFTGSDPSSATKLATSQEQYNQLHKQEYVLLLCLLSINHKFIQPVKLLLTCILEVPSSNLG